MLRLRNLLEFNSAILLLGVFLVVTVGSMREKLPNGDESRHIEYGQSILALNSKRTRDSVMPISALNALPQKIAMWLPSGRLKCLLEGHNSSRCVTIAISMLLACLVFRWSMELYGKIAALFSLFLYVFSPTIIAHSRFTTTDLYAAFGLTASMYLLWRLLNKPSWGRAVIFGLALGLSQLMKYTAVFFYPVSLLLVLLRYASNLHLRSTGEEASKARILGDTRAFLGYCTVIAVIQIVVINTGFLFDRTFMSIGDFEFKSALFKEAQLRLSFLGFMPVPLPYSYIEGLDLVKAHEASGDGFGNLYLLGELRSGGDGFKSYYLVAFLFKMPLAIQLVLVIALCNYVWRQVQGLKTRKDVDGAMASYAFLRDEIFLIIPTSFFIFYFSFLFGAQTGIRYCLVFFPLLFVFAGSVLKGRMWGTIPKRMKLSIGAISIYLVVSVFSYYPHYVAYFNELVWDRTQAYKVLADSNLDWEHDYRLLRLYLKNHPGAVYDPDGPVAGTVIVRANLLTGVAEYPECFEQFRWLRDNFEPVGYAGAPSYLRYEISSEALNTIQ